MERGAGFVVTEDHPDGVASDFDDPDSHWWTVRATPEVDELLGDASGTAPERVRVSLPLYQADDFDRMAAGLEGLGRVVAFLVSGERVGRVASVYRVFESGAMIATVGDGGRLAVPLLPDAMARYVRPLPTLDELERRGEQRRTIESEGVTGSRSERKPPLGDSKQAGWFAVVRSRRGAGAG